MSPGTTALTELAEIARAGMRRMAQSVCVISTVDALGARHAMTASSVTSVSMDPPALLVCVHQDTVLHPVLLSGTAFCINVLSANMQAISQRCAEPDRGERFSLGDWQRHGASGLPYLADAEANFFCAPPMVVQYGTHLICIGALTAARVREGEPRPLIYLDGRYR